MRLEQARQSTQRGARDFQSIRAFRCHSFGGRLPLSAERTPFRRSIMSERLEDIAAAIVANGKGLLAADESSGTIKKRFDVIGVESTADSRRDYREMMFRAKDAMTKYISGVILYDETIRQKAADGTPLVDIIKAAGSIPGIKV